MLIPLLTLAAVAAFGVFLVCRLGRPGPLACIFRAVILAPLMILLALPAMAQEAAGTGLLAAVLPQLLEILATVLSFVLIWAGARFTKRTGIEIEARHRDALHSALMSGARLAAARELTGKAAIGLIIDYVRQSVPEALSKLTPPQAVLADLAEAKLHEATNDRMAELLAEARAGISGRRT